MNGPLAGAARRPVAVLMLVLATVVFGAVSYSRLDLALLPDLNYPTITVRTEYPGAGPRDVDERITEVLEERLATTGGLVSMTSVSRSGFSDITLEFRWDAEMAIVRSDLDAKIAAATLPDEAKRPLILPYDPNQDPILRLAVSARGRSDADLALARKLAEEEIEKELKKLDGVAAAKIRGGREREIAVHLDEEALRRTGIRLAEIAAALDSANRNEAAGLINEGPIEYIVRSVNELRTIAQIGQLVVKHVDGVPIRIRDIGRVEESFKDREIAAFLDGKEAVLVEIFKKGDANLVAVAAAVQEKLFGEGAASAPAASGGRGGSSHRWRGTPGIARKGNLSDALAPYVTIRLLTDQSRFIEGALDEVRDTAALGGFLAVFVLYLFLRSGLVTAIAASVIGICVVATFAPMFLAGVSLNIMSLGGLALGIGMLVDNAIVVLESSSRKRAEGLGPVEAAIAGVRDVAGAITASTLTSVCVFFPIVFVEEAGVAGQIFRDLALTVVFSLLVSLLVALFVIPTCLATFARLGPKAGARGRVWRFGWASRVFGNRPVLAFLKLRRRRLAGKLWFGLFWLLASPVMLLGRLAATLWFLVALVAGGIAWLGTTIARFALWPVAAAFQRGYAAVENAYVPFLGRCLHARGIVLVLALGALAFAGWRATTLSPDLLPESLTGEFDVKVSFPPGTPLEQTAARLVPAEERVRALPGVAWTALTVGVEADADRAADEGEHTAKLTVHLAPEATGPERERAMRRDVEAVLRALPGAQPPEILPSTLFRFALPLNIVFFGGGERDLPRIAEAAELTAREVRTLPGVGSVRVGHGRGAREIRLRFDRDALFRFGVTAEEVAERVKAKVLGQIPTALVEGSARTDIRVRVAEEDRASVRALLELDVASAGQRPLPLRMVLDGDPVVAEGPGEVRRVGGRHAATVEADYEGLQLDRVSEAAEEIARPIAAQLGVDVEVLGRSQEAERSNRALMYAMLLAIFLVYAVMAAQFESLVQPVLIMASLPLAGVGAILLLDLLALPLSVVVLLGSILLVGIAVNNAIVLVDRINQQLAITGTRREAILAAARERLRPILMTTLTTVLGLLPLTGLLGPGAGEAAELRVPMAWTVIGGLVTSTLLTLVVVPVLYDVAGARRRSA